MFLDYGLYLIEIALRKDAPYPVRQMSLVLLRQFVENNWSKTNEHDATSVLTPECKNMIQKEILNGLKELNCKIRNSFAYCIAFMGCKDWPKGQWPGFVDYLTTMVFDMNSCVPSGVIRVYQDILRVIDDNYINVILTTIIDDIYYILRNQEVYIYIFFFFTHTFLILMNISFLENFDTYLK